MNFPLLLLCSVVIFSVQAFPWRTYTSVLRAGEALRPYDKLVSENGLLSLGIQHGANLVLTLSKGVGYKALWQTPSFGVFPDPKFIVQKDGNLVIYKNPGEPVWASNTVRAGSAGENCTLKLQNDGNLVLYDGSGTPVWSTDTFNFNYDLPKHIVYKGCFKSHVNGKPRLDSLERNSNPYPLPHCLHYCHHNNFTFAGISKSNKCHCGNEFDCSLEKLPGQCNTKCDGEPLFHCGNEDNLDVYQVKSHPGYSFDLCLTADSGSMRIELQAMTVESYLGNSTTHIHNSYFTEWCVIDRISSGETKCCTVHTPFRHAQVKGIYIHSTQESARFSQIEARYQGRATTDPHALGAEGFVLYQGGSWNVSQGVNLASDCWETHDRNTWEGLILQRNFWINDKRNGLCTASVALMTNQKENGKSYNTLKLLEVLPSDTNLRGFWPIPNHFLRDIWSHM